MQERCVLLKRMHAQHCLLPSRSLESAARLQRCRVLLQPPGLLQRVQLPALLRHHHSQQQYATQQYAAAPCCCLPTEIPLLILYKFRVIMSLSNLF